MGATASALESEGWADEGLKPLIEEVEQMQWNIAEHERRQLIEQKRFMFKGHEAIQQIICGKSKRQLSQHMILQSSRDDVSFTKKDLSDLLGGGEYGRFMSRLCASAQQLKKHDIHVATSGLGADLESLAYILCLSTPVQMDEIKKICNEGKDPFDLQERMNSKLKEGSIERMFFIGVLNSKRSNDDEGDANNIASQLMEIKSSGHLSDFVKEVLDLSYDQMERVSRELSTSHDVTLEQLVNRLFHDSPIHGYLGMWIQRPTIALAMAVNLAGMTKHYRTLSDIVTRHDKDMLQKADFEYRKMYSHGMDEVLKREFGGNHGKAAAHWLVLPCPDNGKELQIEEFIREYMAKGYDLKALLEWDESCEQIKDMFDRAKFELSLYIQKNHIGLAADMVPEENVEEFLLKQKKGPVSSKYKDKNKENGKKKEKPHTPTIEEEMEMSFAADNVVSADHLAHIVVDEGRHDNFDTKLELVTQYLSDLFYEVDLDKSGALHSEAFWLLFDHLEVMKMAYTREEIDEMKAFCDFDHDGYVIYEEVVYEIADAMIAALEEKGYQIRKTIRELHAVHKEEMDRKKSAAGYSADPQLLHYLVDTFKEFDVEGNAVIPRDKFFEMISGMNLGISEYELSNLSLQFEDTGDNKINIHDAIPHFSDLLHEMASSHRDHWIGLIDKNSRSGFWYVC